MAESNKLIGSMLLWLRPTLSTHALDEAGWQLFHRSADDEAVLWLDTFEGEHAYERKSLILITTFFCHIP